MAYTADDIITWAKISQPLSFHGETKKKGTTGEAVDIDHHIKLYVERKSVEWYNDQATQDANYLYKIANWLWALTFPYGLRAQYIDGGSGGQVVPVTPGTGNLLEPYDFIVSGLASTGAPMMAGDTFVYLDGTNGTRNFKGMNVEFYRGGQPQYTTNPGDGSTYYTWNPVTGYFALNTALQLGEPLRIIPTVAASAPPSSAQEITSVTYDLTTTTVIPNPTVDTSMVQIIITPNGNTYTWDTEYIFSDNYPEQPGATAANTIQIYTFILVSGRWLCIDQSLNIPN